MQCFYKYIHTYWATSNGVPFNQLPNAEPKEALANRPPGIKHTSWRMFKNQIAARSSRKLRDVGPSWRTSWRPGLSNYT